MSFPCSPKARWQRRKCTLEYQKLPSPVKKGKKENVSSPSVRGGQILCSLQIIGWCSSLWIFPVCSKIYAIAAWAKCLTLHSCSIFHLISWGTNSISSSASNLANDYSNIFLLTNQQWQLFNCCQWILCMMDSVSDIQFTWFNLFFYWSMVNSQCCANFCHTTKWLSYTHTHTHTHTHTIFILFSVVVYPRGLGIVPCALQQDFAVCPSRT